MTPIPQTRNSFRVMYSEEELQMVKYYTDEVARLLGGRTKHYQAWEAPRVPEASH
jgi:hypothetical protein